MIRSKWHLPAPGRGTTLPPRAAASTHQGRPFHGSAQTPPAACHGQHCLPFPRLRFGRGEESHAPAGAQHAGRSPRKALQLYMWSSPAPEKSHQPGGATRAEEKFGFQPWTSYHMHERLLPSYTTTLLVQHARLRNLWFSDLPPPTRRDGTSARKLMLPGKKKINMLRLQRKQPPGNFAEELCHEQRMLFGFTSSLP